MTKRYKSFIGITQTKQEITTNKNNDKKIVEEENHIIEWKKTNGILFLKENAVQVTHRTKPPARRKKRNIHNRLQAEKS